jgi:ribosomal protein L37E
MTVCPRCGFDTAEPAARFCPTCGAPMSAQLRQPPGRAESPMEVTSRIALPGSGPAAEPATGDPDAMAEAVGWEALGIDADVIDRLQPGQAMLAVQGGSAAGALFLLDADRVTAGRGSDSDIFLDDITVSRRHAEFRREGEGQTFRLCDVGSLNGTYLNRQRVDDSELATGDEVQIGKFRMVFVAAARGEGEAS